MRYATLVQDAPLSREMEIADALTWSREVGRKFQTCISGLETWKSIPNTEKYFPNLREAGGSLSIMGDHLRPPLPETPRYHVYYAVCCDVEGVLGHRETPFPRRPEVLHTEKSFPNLIKSNRNQIVFTIFRLIWNRKRTLSVCCSKSIGK